MQTYRPTNKKQTTPGSGVQASERCVSLIWHELLKKRSATSAGLHRIEIHNPDLWNWSAVCRQRKEQTLLNLAARSIKATLVVDPGIPVRLALARAYAVRVVKVVNEIIARRPRARETAKKQ
jgi:hypothetical protein